MKPFNLTIDLCSLLGGVLCPLPSYNFTGADSITLPSSVNVAHLLPEIAYKIPDLEAFIQLTLTEIGTGKVRACVQSTLSNGWSARQTGVEWATGGIAFLALAAAVWYSFFRPDSLAPVRFLDVMYLFQSIAASALLALNYSSVYRAYALNFSWALGLFSQPTTSSMQNSIDNMRRLTGGDVGSSGSDSSAISLVNRKLSPYNNYVLPQSVLSRFAALPEVDISKFFAGNVSASVPPSAPHTQVLVGGDVATVTQGSSNTLEAGIPIYVNVLGIATANTFMTVFFVTLILIAIVMFLLVVGWLLLNAISRTNWGHRRADALNEARAGYPAFARAWGFRTALVCSVPVFIFAFYQWTLNDSWLSVLLSVLLLLVILSAVVIPILLIIRPTVFSRFIHKEIDPTNSESLLPFTSPLRRERLYFTALILIAVFVKTLVIAFGQAHGMVQAIILLITEFFVFAIIIVLKPYRSRGADFFSCTLALVRVICTGLMIAFSISLQLNAIPRVVIGIVSAVIWSLAVLLMFFNVLVNLGLVRLLRYMICFRRHRGTFASDATTLSGGQGRSRSLLDEAKQSPGADSDAEKALGVTPTPSTYFRRPENPAPTSTITTVSAFSPATTTLSHFSDPPSLDSPTTVSSTLGELLPHRWSFQHSRPPSASLSVPHTPSVSGGGLSPVTPTTTESHYTSSHSWRVSRTASTMTTTEERVHSTAQSSQ